MLLAKVELPSLGVVVVEVRGQQLHLLADDRGQLITQLGDVLHRSDRLSAIEAAVRRAHRVRDAASARWLPPIDRHEVWAAGVTYKRSQLARMEESETAASVYDQVYEADRPELFFKSTPERVVGPGVPIRARADATWSVPEPELTLLVSPTLDIVGYTIGNDVSSRDIEGDNPLYLPQAKVYNQSCAMGPAVLVQEAPISATTPISLSITRGGTEVFAGHTDLSQMKRKLAELVAWLGRELDFPHGAALMTGTGIVPDSDFTMLPGDLVEITIAEIGTLRNPVEQRSGSQPEG